MEQQFFSLRQAALLFGFRSEGALRKAFERGQLPKGCLVRIGKRQLRVDKLKLERWLRGRKHPREDRLP